MRDLSKMRAVGNHLYHLEQHKIQISFKGLSPSKLKFVFTHITEYANYTFLLWEHSTLLHGPDCLYNLLCCLGCWFEEVHTDEKSRLPLFSTFKVQFDLTEMEQISVQSFNSKNLTQTNICLSHMQLLKFIHFHILPFCMTSLHVEMHLVRNVM